MRIVRRVLCVGLLGAAALAAAPQRAHAVAVDLEVQSEGKPVPEAVVSLETPQGQPVAITTATATPRRAPRARREASSRRTGAPAAERPRAAAPRQERDAGGAAVAVGSDGQAAVDIDDRHRNQPLVAVIRVNGQVVERRQFVASEGARVILGVPPAALAAALARPAPSGGTPASVAAAPVGMPSAINAVQFSMGPSVFYRDAGFKVSRLAREIPNQNEKVHDVALVDQDGTGGGIGFNLRVPFGFGKGPPDADFGFFDFAYGFDRVDTDSFGATGQLPNTSYPGLNVEGTAGQNSNPGGYFAVGADNTFQYSSEWWRHRFDLTYTGAPYRIATAVGTVGIRPLFGVRYDDTSIDDTFHNAVLFNNNPAAHVRYDTRLDRSTVGPYVGGRLSLMPTGAPFEFFVGGRAGYDFSRAETDVTFRIDIGDDFEDVQRTTIKDDKESFRFAVESGVEARFTPYSWGRLSGFVERGKSWNVHVPGGFDSPHHTTEYETFWGGKLAAGFAFSTGDGSGVAGAPMPAPRR
jgi:hypothetical protein